MGQNMVNYKKSAALWVKRNESTEKEKRAKVSVKNGQLCLRTPPVTMHGWHTQTAWINLLYSKTFCIYLLVIPKYWGGNYFAHGNFPEVGQKQKTEKKKEIRKKRGRKSV